MKKPCVASILLKISLAGLAAATEAAAAGSGESNMDAIRLPSDGKGLAGLRTAMARATRSGDEKERPWTCCDLAICTLSYPPICRCRDMVERCPDACEKCEETDDSRHFCIDWYRGDPGPKCHPGKRTSCRQDLELPAGRKRDRGEARPWKCCDQQLCAKTYPPICWCRDELEQCDDACKRCEEVEEGRYRCDDSHFGDPAPPCARRNRRMQRAVAAVLRGYGY